MKKSMVLFLTTALLVIVASANSASADDKIITGPTSSPSANKIAPSGPKVENLSNSECKTLGGSIKDSTICNSKVACTTVDQNGYSHTVCISEEKK
jgi:hypothetical protein